MMMTIEVRCCLPAQVYDRGQRGAHVIAGRALVEAFVKRRRAQNTKRTVSYEPEPMRQRLSIQPNAVFPPLVSVAHRNVNVNILLIV